MAEPRNITIHAQAAHVNLTCVGFHIWAGDFLLAAQTYGPHARNGSFVAHFLCCQSIELSLKAFLSLKGATRKELKSRSFGHDLAKLLDAAVERGLSELVDFRSEDDAVLRVATDWYAPLGGKRLQYFDVYDAVTRFDGAPDGNALEELAVRLQAPALRAAILKEA